jgi:hypothetical protein
MASITMKWYYINWELGYTWNKDIIPQLENHNINNQLLDRAVYVIRTKNKFAIDYPLKPSPTLYIGEGNFKNRINSHKKRWLSDLIALVGDFPIEIAISIPRAKNNAYLYKDVEADLILEFKSLHGMVPFFNKQNEFSKRQHEYINYDEFKKPLEIGKGKKIPWALRPLKSNKNFETFHKANN